jgi:transcriptional regulator with XRE-family HTH domain
VPNALGGVGAELAERSGISAVYLSTIETGAANCSMDILESLAAGLGVSVTLLLQARKRR